MKKAFVAILSLAALVACSQDVTVKRNDSAAIGFDNSFVENKTRAAADPSTTTNSLEEFSVWGFRDTANQLVLNNERVYKNGTEWTYDHLQYWMEGKDYFFGAVSPINPEIVKVDTRTMSKDGLGIISFTNDGSVDLLYAEKTVHASEINPSDPDKVELQFAHLLSRVKFSFEYDFTNELTTVAVKNIKINNSPAQGSIDVTVDRPYWSWTLPQTGETVELEFGDVEGGKEFAAENTYYESDNYRLLIPTDDTRNHNITFDVVVYQNHVESYTYHLATTLKDKAFVQGKSYNIVTTITPDALDMKPIEFKVIEVQGWEDGDVAAPIVLATPDVKADVAENVVTLTWDAIEGADHYTVQVDDDIAEVVKDTTYVFTGDYATEYEFSVVAVPAEGMNIEASEAAVVKATTDAKPAVALATPEVVASVDVNVVTLKWDAVEGASHYTVQVDDDVEETVNATTYVFEGDYEVEYTFTVKAIAADTTKNTNSEAAVVTATTEAKPAVGPTYTSVADFLAAPVDTETYYYLKGTITSVVNTSYGNFDLTDETGTVYVYGLYSEDGATNKYWATSGAKLGDDIVIYATRGEFNGTAQGANARFVELFTPGTVAFYTVDTAAVDFTSAGGEQVVKVSTYNTSAAVTATSDNAAFAVDVNGYVVTVTAAANELEEKVEGNITIKVGELEDTVIKATLAAKPASGVVEGGSDDFHTITSTNTSYVTGKTTAGWNYKNCAIFKGGTSDNSPAFKMIGEENNRALCMNGKTSAVGSITSPTFSTGCGTLKFNYGLPFGDSKMKFRVDIKQNGTVVYTFTVDVPAATKLTLYSHEEVVNVAGDFQIEFTNLSPSNSTSNKDRTAIWDVEWTGYNN